MKDLKPLLEKLIAHRGLHDKDVKENSKLAIIRAINKKIPVEFDITLTKDNVIILCHDNYIKRNNEIYTIKNYEYNFLLKICHELVTLEDVLKLVNGRIPLLIEFKPYNNGNKLEKQAVELLDKYNGYFAIQSFSPLIVYWFKKNRPNYIRGQLLTKYNKYSFIKKLIYKYMIFNKFTNPDFICYNIKGLPNREIEKYRLKKAIIGWTIKNEKEIIKYSKYCDNFVCDNLNTNWRKYESKL